MKHEAVLFIGFGGPEKQDDVMPFLEIVTRGRGIPQERLQDVAHHYEMIGGKSPINEITRQQARALESALKDMGMSLPIFIGQRNWHPFLADTLKQMAQKGIKRAIGFPAAPHRCEASWERYLRAVDDARQKVGASAPTIEYVQPWFDHPLFIEAICERIREVSPAPRPSDPPTPWIFTAHSIPIPMAETSQYVQELRTTARLVCEKFGRHDFSIAYSSRSGRPEDPWLEPDVSDLIRQKAKEGIKNLLFVPTGFIGDHVEILYDLDIEAQQTAKECGVHLVRAKSVGDHPLFGKLMATKVADIALSRV